MKSNSNKTAIVVIGAGPAGLCAAIAAARKLKDSHARVLVLDGSPMPGKKLLLSGNGQCNFSNALSPEEFISRMGKYGNYLKSAFFNFDNRKFISLLQEAGCDSFIREDLKVFPADFKSESVLKALLEQLRNAGATVRCSSPVLGIESLPSADFIIFCKDGSTIQCQKVILATGGASYPGTGSDGKALKFAKALGHQVVPFRPHLCAVSIANFAAYKKCAGISVSNAYGRFILESGPYEAIRDLLITHQGFSGPLILDHSHLLAKGGIIEMNWVDYAPQLLISLKENVPRQSILNALSIANVSRALMATILHELAVPSSQPLIGFSNKQLQKIGEQLMHTPYTISAVDPLSKAMASAGGVPLTEINSKTMQSRICPGLFFAGEIMDYALPTGGFNIQMAASTGWMAGEHAASDI